MRLALQLLVLLLATAATGQDLNSVYIPEEWAKGCSVLNGVFQITDQEYCIYGRSGCDFGGAFWAIINSERKVVRFVQEGEANSILEGYRKGDSLIFAAVWDETDVSTEFFNLRIPYDLQGNRGRPTRIDHAFLVDNGLVFDPTSNKEWIVTDFRVCEIDNGKADTVLRRKYSQSISSADAYEGNLYLASQDTVWRLQPDGSLFSLYRIPNLQSIGFDSNGGLYVLGRKWFYYADSIGSHPEVIQNFNEVRGGPYSLLLGDDGNRKDKATLVYTSRKEQSEIEGTGVVFEKGQAIDTLRWVDPTFEVYKGIYSNDGILGVGIQRSHGTMYKAGVVSTRGEIKLSDIDLAIGVNIDTSYWRYDTTPRPSVVKTHNWDYTVTLINEGTDTVHFGDVFSPTAFSAWFFEFRQYCGFKEVIPPGDSIKMTCKARAHLYDQVVGQQCMAVDAIDTYLDKDYSNNVSCAKIPRPIGVGTADIPVTEFAIYPNPGHGMFTHDLDLKDPLEIRVVDFNGIILHTEEAGPGQIDLSDLPAGVYTILITAPQGVFRSTAVIQP